MRISPRFGVILGAMALSIAFTVVDICSITDTIKSALPVGINPFWKLAFVFKLLTDTVILDDFKTALDKLCAVKLASVERPLAVTVDVEYGTSRESETALTDMPSKVQHRTVVQSDGCPIRWLFTVDYWLESSKLYELAAQHVLILNDAGAMVLSWEHYCIQAR
jgi:hypothetical protein